MSSTPGETNVPIGDWTTGTLKIYHDEKLDALRQHYDSLRDLDMREYDKLREADQRALKAALQAVKEDNEKKAVAMEKRFDSVNEFRQTLSDQTSTFLPRPEYVANHKALEDKIQALTDRMNLKDGATKGSELTIGKIYAAIGGVGAILAIIVLLANNAFN